MNISATPVYGVFNTVTGHFAHEGMTDPVTPAYGIRLEGVEKLPNHVLLPTSARLEDLPPDLDLGYIEMQLQQAYYEEHYTFQDLLAAFMLCQVGFFWVEGRLMGCRWVKEDVQGSVIWRIRSLTGRGYDKGLPQRLQRPSFAGANYLDFSSNNTLYLPVPDDEKVGWLRITEPFPHALLPPK